MPTDDLMDLSEVGRLQELSFIRLDSETELQGIVSRCELGAMAPFRSRGLPVVIDRQDLVWRSDRLRSPKRFI